MTQTPACYNFFHDNKIFRRGLGIGGLVYLALYFVSASITFFWLWRQRSIDDIQREAFEGRSRKNYSIFPIYIPVLIYSVVSDIFYGLVLLFSTIQEDEANSWPISGLYASVFACQHFMLEGLAIALCQYGCGNGAAKSAMTKSAFVAIFTFGCFIIRFGYNDVNVARAAEVVWQVAIGLFYFVVWLLPKKHLYRRPAVYNYAKFWAIFRTFCIFGDIFYDYGGSNTTLRDIGSCTEIFFFFYLYVVLKPFVVYYTLLADTVWWQGQRTANLSLRKKFQQSAGNIFFFGGDAKSRGYSSPNKRDECNNPIQDVESSLSVAQDLATAVDDLHSTGGVNLLHYGFIKYNKKDKLGAGSFSNVYVGKYRGIPVAIKLLLTIDLTPEVIGRCVNEAQILSRIKHRNVVCCLGVSVLPPRYEEIFIEVRQRFVVQNVLRGTDSGGVKKRPLNLNMADRMYLALGCARGLHALHTYSSTLCHRDIKSMNFLVDAQLEVKIADLELGYTAKSVFAEQDPNSSGNNDEDSLHRILNNNSLKEYYQSDAMISPWCPPEVYRGETYTQASDIYSLSLVIWEIIAASHLKGKSQTGSEKGTPFWEFSRYEIKKEVMEGRRPIIPPNQDHRIVDLITRGWSNTPSRRPDSEEFCVGLAKCWRSVVHKHIEETEHLIDISAIKSAHDKRCEARARSNLSKWSNNNQWKSPSPALLNALSVMKNEYRWSKLEDQGAYLITTPEPPFIILWATKKWTQLTGYVLNDILADDLTILSGPKTDNRMINQALGIAYCGETSHIMASIYRRDLLCLELSLHAFPIFDNRSDFSVRDPCAVFGPEAIPFSVSRASSTDTQFLAHSPSRQPGTLATVVEGRKESSIPADDIEYDSEGEENDEINRLIPSQNSMSTLDSEVRSITPHTEPGVEPAFSYGSSSALSSYEDSSMLRMSASSTGRPIARPVPLTYGFSVLPSAPSPEIDGGMTGGLVGGSSSCSTSALPTGRGKDKFHAPGTTHSFSSSANSKNAGILSSILASHDLSGRYLGDESVQLGPSEETLLAAAQATEAPEVQQQFNQVANTPSPSPFPSSLAVSGGIAYTSNIARQFRSDSITQQRLGQLIQMAEEENDASVDLLRRSLYSQSLRSSITSFVACKKVSYVAILFSDIKEGK